MSARIPRCAPRPGRMKRCAKCRESYPVECYQRDKTLADGLRAECKACRSERRKELRDGAPRLRPWTSRRLDGIYCGHRFWEYLQARDDGYPVEGLPVWRTSWINPGQALVMVGGKVAEVWSVGDRGIRRSAT